MFVTRWFVILCTDTHRNILLHRIIYTYKVSFQVKPYFEPLKLQIISFFLVLHRSQIQNIRQWVIKRQNPEIGIMILVSNLCNEWSILDPRIFAK